MQYSKIHLYLNQNFQIYLHQSIKVTFMLAKLRMEDQMVGGLIHLRMEKNTLVKLEEENLMVRAHIRMGLLQNLLVTFTSVKLRKEILMAMAPILGGLHLNMREILTRESGPMVKNMARELIHLLMGINILVR